MTKKEVCTLLSISPKTLERRMAKGTYKFTRSGEGQYAPVSFTFADLGLPEPVPVPTTVLETVPAVEPTPEPEPQPTPCQLSDIELKEQADRRFADDYRRGLVGDSAGNRIDGTNERFPTRGAQSLVGSADMYDSLDRTPTEMQAHMNPALLGSLKSEGQPFDKGVDAETHEQMMRDWRRRNGRAPSMSQQREAQERSVATINESFNYARGRR